MKRKIIAATLNILFLPFGYYYQKFPKRFIIFLFVNFCFQFFLPVTLYILSPFLWGKPFLYLLGIFLISWNGFIVYDTVRADNLSTPSMSRFFKFPHTIWIVVAYILLLIPISLLRDFVKTHTVEAKEIKSNSMRPSLLEGDYIFVRAVHEPDKTLRGKKIAYRVTGDGSEKHYMHRLIGVSGDQIRFSNAPLKSFQNILHININGQELPMEIVKSQKLLWYGIPKEELFIQENNHSTKYLTVETDMTSVFDDIKIELKDGEYFVIGDNRDDAKDSRFTGVVRAADITHEYMFTYFSIDYRDELCDVNLPEEPARLPPEHCADILGSGGTVEGLLARWHRLKIRWDRVGTISN